MKLQSKSLNAENIRDLLKLNGEFGDCSKNFHSVPTSNLCMLAVSDFITYHLLTLKPSQFVSQSFLLNSTYGVTKYLSYFPPNSFGVGEKVTQKLRSACS